MLYYITIVISDNEIIYYDVITLSMTVEVNSIMVLSQVYQ